MAKIIFGAEPSDETVRLTVMRHYRSLQFSQPVSERPPKTDAGGYKRRQRELKHMLEQEQAASDEFHQALAAERERARMEREKAARAAREAEEQRKFQLRQERHKEKKKGH